MRLYVPKFTSGDNTLVATVHFYGTTTIEADVKYLFSQNAKLCHQKKLCVSYCFLFL